MVKLLPTVVLATYSMKSLKGFFFSDQSCNPLEQVDFKREKYKGEDEKNIAGGDSVSEEW